MPTLRWLARWSFRYVVLNMPVYTDKKTGRYYIEFQYKGHPHKERLPAGTKRSDAEALEVKLRNDILMQSHGLTTPNSDMTFERFLAEYFSVHILGTCTESTVIRAIGVTKAALPFFKGKPLRTIKPADVERFKAARTNLYTQHGKPRKPATIVREMAVIGKIFALAVKNDFIDYNPCSRVEQPKFDNIQDKVLKREDEDLFFANIHSEWTTDICKLVLNTGLRQKDIMTLRRFDVDRVGKCITRIQTKTGRQVIAVLNSTALAIIEKHWNNGSDLLFPSPVTGTDKGSVRSTMVRACQRAGIEPHLTIRDLRRTFGTRLHENGQDTMTVARMLGHSGLRSVFRYQRSTEMMRKAADSLEHPATIPPAAKMELVKPLKTKGKRNG